MTVLLTLAAVVGALAIYAFGFRTGYNACQEAERKADMQRRIGAAMEHWHGHTTHKGGTILSPVRVAGGIQ